MLDEFERHSMSIEATLSDTGGAVAPANLNDFLNLLKRIESILRNGLPTDDKSEVITIAHAHSEIELLLESVDENWWMK